MSKSVEIAGNLLRVEFAANTMPVFIEKKNKDYVYFGEQNNYPSFLLQLYRQHPEHGAIIKAKVNYIYGKGLYINQEKTNTIELAKGQIFLSVANRFEDWNSVYRKTVKSYTLFNGFAWQIIWSIGGTKCEVYHINLSNLRKSPCGKYIDYCKSWLNKDGTAKTRVEDDHSFKRFDAFNPNVRKGTQIYYYVEPEESAEEYGDIYPIPEYIQTVTNIATDIGISDFQNCLVENGMTAQGMLSLFNGNPENDEKKKYEKMFNNKFTGPQRAGRIIFNFVDKGPDAKGAEYTSFATTDLDKLFEGITKNNQQKIVTGHQVTNKSLVGISVEGALSDRTAIIVSHEQMQNTYTEPRQQNLIKEIKMIGELQGNSLVGLEVQQNAPIGVDIADPNIAIYFTEDEIRNKLGFKPKETDDDEIIPPAAQVNENLKGLKGRDWIHIKRLIREVQKQKTTREAATLMLKNGYGLSDTDIDVLFGPVKMRKVEDAISLFESFAVQESEDEILSEEYVNFKGSKDCHEHEFKIMKRYFDMGEKELSNKVLDILKGDPYILPEKIARQLDVDSERVLETIDKLADKKLVEKSPGKIVPTEKGIDKNVPPVDVEIYTVYKYVTRPDVPRASTSRPFCKRMLELSRDGKVWTREALDKLTNDLGEDAWIYRGGFYKNPDTGIIEPFCRHVWKSITKRRKRG